MKCAEPKKKLSWSLLCFYFIFFYKQYSKVCGSGIIYHKFTSLQISRNFFLVINSISQDLNQKNKIK